MHGSVAGDLRTEPPVKPQKDNILDAVIYPFEYAEIGPDLRWERFQIEKGPKGR
jgi:hypothetical protein